MTIGAASTDDAQSVRTTAASAFMHHLGEVSKSVPPMNLRYCRWAKNGSGPFLGNRVHPAPPSLRTTVRQPAGHIIRVPDNQSLTSHFGAQAGASRKETRHGVTAPARSLSRARVTEHSHEPDAAAGRDFGRVPDVPGARAAAQPVRPALRRRLGSVGVLPLAAGLASDPRCGDDPGGSRIQLVPAASHQGFDHRSRAAVIARSGTGMGHG